MATILLGLGGLALVLAVHPFLTYPIVLRLMRRFAPAPALHRGRSGEPLRVALCVCAYNEAGVIERKIANMLDLRDRVPGLEILLYVDAATDGTAAIAARYADRIRLVVATERRGKTHGMNQLVAATAADIVVFTDANVMFDAEAIPRLAGAFADPIVGCACGHLRYVTRTATATAETGSLYWRLEEGIKQLESDTGSVMGADGSIFAIRRALHRPPPPDIIDDMYVSLSILCDGHRIVRVGDALATEESIAKPAEEFRRKIRIACQAFNVHRLLWPRLRRLDALTLFKYVSHKLLRWLSIYALLLGIALVVAGLLVAGQAMAVAVLAALAGGVLLFGAARPAARAARLLDVLAALVATGIGVLRSLRGDRFQTWTPAASIRRERGAP
ncbi:MAG: glycosyltransferase [Alphaproteobacteria bacterium]|nr:glycosyltransferase [Alphaproteobacteria bacterium]